MLQSSSATNGNSLKAKRKHLLSSLLKEKGLAAGHPDDRIIPVPAERHVPFPLNAVQQAYAAGRSSHFDLGNIATHGYQEFEVENLDPVRYQHAWDRLIRRHDTLRIVIKDESTQQILEQVPHYSLPLLDLRGMPVEERDLRLLEVREAMSHQVIPLGTWPMFDVRMTLLDGDITRLHFSFDALLMDGSSFPVLMEDIRWLYEHPEQELPPLSLSFRDYVLALQHKEKRDADGEDAAYWRNRLPDIAPAPEFSLKRKLAEVEKPHFIRLHAPWSLTRWAALEESASAMGLTATTLLLTAFAEVLRLWNRHPSFSLNVSFFNRLDLHEEVGKILGDFTDLMLFSVDYRPDSTLLERAKGIQERFWEDMQHRSFSGVQVIRELIRSRGGAGSAVMPVVFTNLLKVGDISRGAALEGHPFELRHSISQTPQVLIDLHVYQYGDTIGINWDTVEDVFHPGQLQDMFAAFCGLLERMEQDSSIWRQQRVLALPEEQRLRHACANETEAPLEAGLLHGMVAEAASLYPDNAAIIAGERVISHAELQNRVRSLAHRLRTMGAKPGCLIAVLMEKGWEQVVAVLGILESGAAYLPIDIDFPHERVRQILSDAESNIVLTQASKMEELELPGELRVLAVEESAPAEDERPLKQVQSPDDIAYVIYTSGSTGKPKGVVITHRAAVNTIKDINARFSVGPSDRMLALSDLNFDLSVYDIFGVLGAGGAVVLPQAGQTREPAHWQRLMLEHGITLWNSVPMLLQMLLAHAEGEPFLVGVPVRLIMLSGDWVPVSLPGNVRAVWPKAVFAALGGATEAAIWSNVHVVESVPPHWKSIPYGIPLTNQRYLILNDAFAECPDHVPGNLFIAGEGLARGYWNDPERTESSFINHPVTGERLYRTGDMGCWLPEGIIEFLGRTDSQVKVGGYRIELGEVESVLAQCAGVKEVVARVTGTTAHSRRIIGYVVSGQGQGEISSAAILEKMRTRLPRYMVPAAIVQLEALPLLPNGKVNRKALPLTPESSVDDGLPPKAGPERSIVHEWQAALDIPHVRPADNFFEIGGNSLIAVRTLAMIKRSYGVDVSLRDMFDAPTAASLGARVSLQMENDTEALEEGCI